MMLLFSTPQSVEEGKPSVFAALETLIMTAISLGIAIQFHTLTHIAVSACIVPFLLLRSDKSVRLGLEWFHYTMPEKSKNIVVQFWNSIRMIVLSLFIRVGATMYYFSRGIKEIPTNWFRVVFCTDIYSNVEFVPGSGNIKDTMKYYSSEFVFLDFDVRVSPVIYFLSPLFILFFISGVVTLSTIIFPNYDISIALTILPFSIVLLGLFLAGFVFSYVAASYYYTYAIIYLYRFGLKSTALVWLPLIYAVTSSQNLSLRTQILESQQSGRWRILRVVSWLTLGFLAIKIVVLPSVIDWWNSQNWTAILNVYVMPNIIHPWHIASGVNAIIILCSYYLFMDIALFRVKDGVWSKQSVLNALQKIAVLRGIISVYTVAAGLWLTVIAAMSMKWPQWSSSFWPQ